MIINAISGFAASSRKQSDTLGGFLGCIGEVRGEFVSHSSANPHCIADSLQCARWATNSDSDTLLLIGKSLGAVRTWWLAYNHWDEIKHFKKIRIILIDPHGWQRGDGRWGSYGRKMLNGKWRNLLINRGWRKHNDFEIINVFQRGSFPMGAVLSYSGSSSRKDAIIRRDRSWYLQNIRMPPGANHWNCTDIKTDTGQFVAGVIRGVVEGL